MNQPKPSPKTVNDALRARLIREAEAKGIRVTVKEKK